MCKVTHNQEKNGIELRFESKPDQNVIDQLKANGFRWSIKQKMWYAKESEQRMEFVNSVLRVGQILECGDPRVETGLFDLTRTDAIESHVDKNMPTKEIASQIRNHIRSRFPMCKFSVTSSASDSIHISVKSSPYDKDSEIIKAIMDYVKAYAHSFKYCTDYNPYGDYGSSYNFYDGYPCFAYDYEVREMTVHELNQAEQFIRDRDIYEAQQAVIHEEEIARMHAQQEAEAAASRIEEEMRSAAHQKVEDTAVVQDLDKPYFLQNCIEFESSKLDSISEYLGSSEETKRCTCHVSREVHLTPEHYTIFANQLLDDWSFIAGTGCSRTDDRRISSYADYSNMPEAERKTVQWYSAECVAIYCGDKLMFVVDAQGYDYCRYVYLADSETVQSESNEIPQILSEEEYNLYLANAETLWNVSAEIIIQNGWAEGQKWQLEYFAKYSDALIRWMEDHSFLFNVHVIRAIPEERGAEFKSAMYRILEKMKGAQYQFSKAGFECGQKITIVRIGEFGGVSIRRGVYDSHECSSYAQYQDAVKMIFRPERMRSMYSTWFYRDALIYDGYLPDLPEDLLYDIETNGTMVIRRSKYASFDNAQYDVIMKHYEEMGAVLLVNTYKPSIAS